MPKIKRRRNATDELEEEKEEIKLERERQEEKKNIEPVTAHGNIMSLNTVSQASQDARAARPLHPEEVKALISEFDGTYDAAIWIRKIEHYQKLYGWTDNAALLYATTRLAGPAKLWYSSVEEKIFGFTGFKVMLLTTFPSYHDEADVHRELMAVMKTAQESYENYVFRVQNIASKGNVSEASIIKYIISGLSRDRLYEQIASNEYNTVYSLLKRIKWCESNLRLKKTDAGTLGATRQPMRQSVPVVKVGAIVAASELICFNCNASGHKSINCPKPQRRPRCTSCSKVGHTVEQCFKLLNNGKPVQPMVAMITAKEEETSTQDSVPNERIDTDENGMLKCDAIIGRRLKQLNLLVDSGSAVSLIKRSELSMNRLEYKIGQTKIDLSGINNSKVKVEGKRRGILDILYFLLFRSQ
ncbi:uncharacterized protein LOC134219168 isoform X1 [Armigeres subalbatus]|uniref:uncharacterized protein LOC134219168 isoform X1 n=1 Tax=Armigeres subalbatus TaxID=124917 RepID=UPI002ED00776